MNLSQIEAFCTIANTGSVSEAARQLECNRTKLSMAIKAFETELGVELFARTGNNLTLSEAGKAIYKDCESILITATRIRRTCSQVSDEFAAEMWIARDDSLPDTLWQDLAHWQRGSSMQLTDRTLAVVDIALWDLAGRKLGMPVYKLIGAYRDKVPAYGSIMCGDELEGGLATPEDYGRFAEKLVARGYQAIKLHTWMPPVSWSPNVEMDIKACAAVREAVGPDFDLMLDAYHWYSRTDALKLGRGLEKLNFTWIEEVMDEQSMASYVWLTENLDIPVIGPESMGGKYFHRAEWIKAGACDILRKIGRAHV